MTQRPDTGTERGRDPAATDSETVQPEATRPQPAQPEATRPQPAEPEATERREAAVMPEAGAAGERPGAAAPDARPEAHPGGGEQAAAVAELEDRWRRALANLDNLRKRCARELEAERSAERGRVAGAWLGVVDNLDLALRHADQADDPLAEGVRAVRDQAVELLAGLGYPRDEGAGVRFDPARHEAVGVADANGAEPGTVVEVVRPGYGHGERQLRPAAVVVARPRG